MFIQKFALCKNPLWFLAACLHRPLAQTQRPALASRYCITLTAYRTPGQLAGACGNASWAAWSRRSISLSVSGWVPRRRARAEEHGPLVIFVPTSSGWPYYARPRYGPRPPITAADIRAVRARQRELVIPESFEWI